MSVNLSPKHLAFDPCAENKIGNFVRPAPHASFGSVLRHLKGRVVAWQERAQMRRGLAAMDDRLLRDIGLTRAQASREYGKPFWRS
jgi:uncharacterized protein YjiS (DUF1127 family)